MIRKQIAIALLSLPFIAHGQGSNEFLDKWDSLMSWYEPRLTKVNIIGNGMVVVKNSEIVAENMYGFQDQDTREPITLNTIYNWASCTKMFTAIAMMQLRDAGILALNDPISKHLPEVKSIQNEFDKEPTIKQVLTHTSGFPRFSKTTQLIDGNFYETQSEEAYLEAFEETALEYTPGTVYRYSNMGYDILGLLIERVINETYTSYVTKNILTPLGMKNSYFNVLPDHLQKYRSNNYRGHRKKLYSKAQDFDKVDNTGLDHPSGGLNAPMTDMLLFVNFLCGINSSASNPLKHASIEEMLVLQQRVHGKQKNGQGHDHFKGLGIDIINPDSFRLVGHDGESSGFMSSVWVNTETKSGYLFAWNTTYRLPNKKDDKLFKQINNAMYGEVLPLLK